MLLLYYVLIGFVYVFCALALFVLSFLRSKYKNSLKARFFLYKNLHQARADVHFHACSFGEVRSIKSLVLDFQSRITCITQSAFDEAKSFCKKVNFLAFELFIPFWLQPCKVLVLFEAELWLMLVFVAKMQGAKIILLNARISEPSFKKYKKFRFFYRKIFSYIDEIYAQSFEDKLRLEKLGAKRVYEYFNIKAALKTSIHKNYLKPKEKLFLFASTHEGEEELLLSHFKLEKGEKLIIAPRHPERFAKLKSLMQNYSLEQNLSFSSFSEEKTAFLKSDIILLDALGELVNFYAICDVAVLCGSFIKGIGGHNPIEIAQFEKILISGLYIHNQKSLYNCVENIIFCEDLKDFNSCVRQATQKAKLKHNFNLSLIKQSIQEGINAAG